MLDNFLIKTLSQLTKKKVTRFKEFVNSPYFNKHQDTKNLINYLAAIYPNFSQKKCDRYTMFKYLYPSTLHDQRKLAIVFTYALRLLEQFFRVEESIKHGMLSNNTLLSCQLRELDLQFLLKNKWKEIYEGVNINQNDISLPNIKAHDELNKISVQLADFENDFLQRKQLLLDRYYLLEKLKDSCELLQRSKLLKKEFIISDQFQTNLNWIKSNRELFSKIPEIILFYDLFDMIKNNDVEKFYKIKSTVKIFEQKLNLEVLETIYNYLQNFCIQQINSGKKEFLNELFIIYKSQLEKGLLLEKNHLSEWHFKNIVTTALRLEEYNWVKNFILNSKTLLRPNVMENAFTFNLANYYYHTGDFAKVLELLLQVEYTDLRYNLDAKALLLRTYYDLEEEDALISLTASFRQYLKRNKELTEFQKAGYYNLLKLTRSTFRLKSNKRLISHARWKSGLDKIMTNLNDSEVIFNKVWLQEKINELGS